MSHVPFFVIFKHCAFITSKSRIQSSITTNRFPSDLMLIWSLPHHNSFKTSIWTHLTHLTWLSFYLILKQMFEVWQNFELIYIVIISMNIDLKIQCLKVTQKGLILLTWSCMHAWLDFPILRYCSGTVSDSAMIVREIKIKIQDELMVIWKLPINWQQVS